MYSSKVDLDKFYTKESVAIKCLKYLKLDDYDCVIEPSAGTGSFSNNIIHKNLLAFDLEPGSVGIIKQNWFDYSHIGNGKVLIVGNPPFGKRNALSKAFIKHSLSFAQTIAMILPDVYKKHTLQSIFPKGWRLKQIIELEKNAFIANNEEYHVPCCFFIFDKSNGVNLMFDKSKYISCEDFNWSTKEDSDLFIMGAGQKVKYPNEVTPNNRGYYLKALIDVDDLINKLNSVKWVGYSSVNGGVSWLTKYEIIKLYKNN